MLLKTHDQNAMALFKIYKFGWKNCYFFKILLKHTVFFFLGEKMPDAYKRRRDIFLNTQKK